MTEKNLEIDWKMKSIETCLNDRKRKEKDCKRTKRNKKWTDLKNNQKFNEKRKVMKQMKHEKYSKETQA